MQTSGKGHIPVSEVPLTASVQAAVEQERRLAGIESALVSIRESIDRLTAQVREQNSRIGKNESAIAAVRTDMSLNEQKIADLQPYSRITGLETAVNALERTVANDRIATTAKAALWKSQWAVLAAGFGGGGALVTIVRQLGLLGMGG